MSEQIEVKFVTNTPEFIAESKRIEEAITGIEDKHNEAIEDMTENIAIQKSVLQDLERQYRDLEKMVKKSPVGGSKSAMQSEMASIKLEIDAERLALEKLNTEQKKYDATTRSLRTQIMNQRNAMAQMTEGTEEYYAAMKKLGELQDRMGDIQAQGRVFADDEKYTRVAMETVQGLTGAMSAGVGVATLFGASQENLAKIQARLQAVMAISIGVNQVAQVLNKDSYFTHVVLAKAKAVDATVTGVLSGAMAKLGLTTAAANVAAKGLMITVTGGLVVGIWALMSAYDSWSSAEDERKAKVEEAAAAQREFNRAVADSAAAQIVAYKTLQQSWSALVGDLAAKEKFVKDNQKAFDDLGVSITGVKDAENLFNKGSEAFIESLVLRAKAAANAAIAMDLMKEAYAVKNQDKEAVSDEDTAMAWKNVAQKTFGARYKTEFLAKADLYSLGKKDYEEYEKEVSQTAQRYADIRLADKKREADDKIALAEKSITEEGELLKQASETISGAGISTPDPNKGKKEPKPTSDTTGDVERLSREARERQNSIAQAEVDAMAEGSDKKIAQLELNHSREIEKLEQQAADVLQAMNKVQKAKGEEELGALPAAAAADFGTLKGAADRKLTTGIAEITKSDLDKILENMQAEDAAYNDFLLSYGSYYEKKFAIAKSYSDKIAAATTEGEKLSLGKEQQKADADLDSEQMKLTDSWTQVFRDLRGMSRAEVQVLIGEINEQLQNEKLAPADASALLGQLNKAKDFQVAMNPFASLIEGIGNVKIATQELEAAKADLATAEKSGDKGKIDAAKKKKEEAEVKVADTKEERNVAASESINKVSGVANATSDLLKNFGVESPAVDGVVNSLSALGEINFSNPVSIITGGLKAVSSLLGGIFGEMDAVKEKKIQEIQKQVDDLQKSYDKLGEEIDKAYSSDAANLIKQQNEMLEQQSKLIDQQIKEEESKKKSDKSKVDSYKKAQEDIKKQQEENREKAIDAIFGSDLQSAIDNFATAYMNAWGSGEDRAKAQKDVVKKMKQDVIKEMLKNDIEDSVKKMREKVALLMEDGSLSDSDLEQIDKMGDEVGQILEKKGNIYEKVLKTDSDKEEDALTGAIRGSVATEESVSELGGIMRRDSDNIFKISNTLDLGFTAIAEMARTNALIEANTRRTADNTDGLTSRIDDTNKKLDTVIKNTTPVNVKY